MSNESHAYRNVNDTNLKVCMGLIFELKQRGTNNLLPQWPGSIKSLFVDFLPNIYLCYGLFCQAKYFFQFRFKMKVGSDLSDDIRRATIFREEIGWNNFLVKH